ncbi:TonB-dependent receptor [Pedobacter caeni]|uniref:Iron complex outermembrane recepter protein n=1 Tax=Pedobacter caeni TaxID=288992 RepID=A0A1M5BJU4_9SPHI|nr:TonB-dependent receptor [Pedobacter caeni]SHF42719.1 iron complex outermembrane recepter protein [Pedobacter caeni]
MKRPLLIQIRPLFFTLSLVFLFLHPISLFAQKTGSVNGSIKTNDQEALPYATVTLKDTRFGSMANERGDFKFDAPSGTYILTVTYAGYVTTEKKITVVNGQSTDAGVLIVNSAANQLREVVVADIQKNKYSKKNTSTVARMPLSDLENPQAYSVVGKDFMQELVATDFNSAVMSVPGAVVNNGINDSGNDITLRGFITNATFRNGLAVSPRTQSDIVNVERVEVLKGPSATLFGGAMSTYGGAVNTVTKKPFESFRGEVGYTTGSWGMNRLTADINTPLNKDRTALLRFNAAGFTQNSFQDAGFNKGAAFALSMSFKTSERTTVRFDADYYAPNKTLNAYVRNSNILTVGSIAELPGIHDRTFTSNDLGTKRTTLNAMAEIEHKISDHWTSRTSYQHTESGEKGSIFLVLSYLNNTQISRGIRPFDVFELTSDNIQQNFVGDFKIGQLRNRLVVGGDYLYRKTYNQYATFNTGTVAAPRYSVFMPYDEVTLNATSPSQSISRSTITQKDNALRSSTTAQADMNFSFSAYASNAINLTDWIIAMAGLRVDRYEVKRSLNNGVALSNNYTQVQYSPKFGLVIQPIKDVLTLFGNYSNGFTNNQPGLGANQEIVQWKPTQAFQTEGGIKAELFEGRFSTTISYYDIKVKDVLNNLPDGTQEQNGNQRSKGFEAEFIANPIEGLNLITGYAYNDNRYTNYISGKNNYTGNRAPWVPEHTFNFWASYKLLSGKAKGLGLGAGANYAAKAYLDQANKAIVPAFTTIGTTLFYDQPKYRVALKVNNLANKTSWNFYGQPQNPRQFVANVSYKF